MSAQEFSAIDRQWLRRQTVGLLIVAIALLATFETSGLDLRLQREFFDPALNGFPLKEHWFATRGERDARLAEMSGRYVYFRPGDAPALDFETVDP